MELRAPHATGAPEAEEGGSSVDTGTVRKLIALNNRFYAEHAASFSATRSAPWAGWQRLADELRGRDWNAVENDGARSVLDLACGNLRFERFLMDAFPELDLRFEAIDSCPALADSTSTPGVLFRQFDILTALLDGPRPAALLKHTRNLTACFGFMHHIPSEELRCRVLNTLIDATEPNGFITLSFWQFMNDKRLAVKAERSGVPAAISPAKLEANDHFLGWQDDMRPLRYCHHFDEMEIDRLVDSVAPRAHELSRWSADGTSGTLNRYLLLQRS